MTNLVSSEDEGLEVALLSLKSVDQVESVGLVELGKLVAVLEEVQSESSSCARLLGKKKEGELTS